MHAATCLDGGSGDGIDLTSDAPQPQQQQQQQQQPWPQMKRTVTNDDGVGLRPQATAVCVDSPSSQQQQQQPHQTSLCKLGSLSMAIDLDNEDDRRPNHSAIALDSDEYHDANNFTDVQPQPSSPTKAARASTWDTVAATMARSE